MASRIVRSRENSPSRCGICLARRSSMLIRRCVWHRTYHSYPLALGIASWRGFGVSFTDGMCRGCAIRFRRQWDLPAMSSAPALPFMRVAVTGAIAMILILAVRSSDSGRMPATMTPPPETVLVPTSVEAEPTPALPVPRPVRRVSRRVASSAKPAVVAPPARREPWPSFNQRDTEPFVLVSASDSGGDGVESDRPSPARPRFPRRSMFAALPHAGLTQQTP